jgi:cytochrome c oxidase assembly protein subunit 15
MNSTAPARYRASLHVYGLALCVCTFLLLFAGGMVTSTNSGLSVPDWPTTFGQNMFTFPPSMMKGGIFYEHGHRLFASLVGFLTIGNCLAFWLWDKRRWLRWTGVLALLLVIVQGTLGGMTVKYKLPMPVSAAHACTAELFFMVTVLMAFATSRAWLNAASARIRWSAPEQALSLLFCVSVFLQILVGAVMRHSYAGLSIPTFPLAYGQIVPPFWNFGIIVHFLHTRVGAPLVVLLGTALIVSVFVSRRQVPRVKALAGFLAFALVVQCLLGMFTIWTGKAPVPTTFHLSVGALVFATGFLLFLSVYRLRKPGSLPAQSQETAPASTSQALEKDKVALT